MIKIVDGTVREARTHESALVKHLMSKRRSLLSTEPARVEALFAALPK